MNGVCVYFVCTFFRGTRGHSRRREGQGAGRQRERERERERERDTNEVEREKLTRCLLLIVFASQRGRARSFLANLRFRPRPSSFSSVLFAFPSLVPPLSRAALGAFRVSVERERRTTGKKKTHRTIFSHSHSRPRARTQTTPRFRDLALERRWGIIREHSAPWNGRARLASSASAVLRKQLSRRKKTSHQRTSK